MKTTRDQKIHATLRAFNIPIIRSTPVFTVKPNGSHQFMLDQALRTALSSLVIDHGHSVQDLAELVREQTSTDYRLNKALCPNRFMHLLHGYKFCGVVCSVVAIGIAPRWSSAVPFIAPGSKNHQSANRHLNAVIKSVRRGQDAGQYLVLSGKVISCLDAVYISPLGAVAKKDTYPQLDVRLIHDLSFPRERSANEASDKEHFPQIEYQHVAAIARRVESLSNKYPGQAICILKGDVKSAFRHLMLASPHVLRMGARIPQLQALLLDMSAPFGWSGSPSYYGAFGGAISWLLGCESPSSMSGGASPDSVPFFAYEWVDDHVLVEVDTPMRLHLARETLRMAMLAVLGPRAINEENFSTWATNIEVLGLVFDARLRMVSMPPSKISKALARVTRLASSPTALRSDLQQLLGSLRHVFCYLRAAKPFFQRVHSAAKRAPRRGRVQLTSAVRWDLQWFRSILVHGQWSGLPLVMFRELPPASVHLYMDSSNEGLAVLDPANRRYI